METISYHKGYAQKTVVVGNVHAHSDTEVLAYAMRKAGEDRSSLFDYRVTRHDGGTATVTLSIG